MKGEQNMIKHFTVLAFSIEKPNNKQSRPNPYIQIINVQDENQNQRLMMTTYGVPFIELIYKHGDLTKIKLNSDQDLWQRQTLFKYANYFLAKYVPGYYIDKPIVDNLKRNLAEVEYFNVSNDSQYFENFRYSQANCYEK